MSDQEQQCPEGDWHFGGWDGAERETLRFMRDMTFEQKLAWLEQAQEVVASIHGWEAALQPGGTLVNLRRQAPSQAG